MLAPNWLHVHGHVGPLRRRERDNRMYHLLFQFPGYITGARWWWLLATRNRILAEQANLSTLITQKESALIIFSNRVQLNEETHFHEVVNHGAELKDELISITRPQHRPHQLPPHIALHVRMGDFSPMKGRENLRQGSKNSRIPIDWYVEMLQGLRKAIGPVKALLYSDGSDIELAPLLALPAVARPPKAPSITDLLCISQAKVLISSGSGFSKWGAFLGEVPRVCFPGQRFVRVLPANEVTEREPECEYEADLPETFIDHIAGRFRT
jgi:hypothetical protein